ncbi:MAG: hypothetical protein H8E42_11325 [Nitrospinae bacterium]|nr:hypothetical protein [Nitrospinota bacterium]MBL7019771.1 hypothetical protein [Nitrospinaceae bacterium]
MHNPSLRGANCDEAIQNTVVEHGDNWENNTILDRRATSRLAMTSRGVSQRSS